MRFWFCLSCIGLWLIACVLAAPRSVAAQEPATRSALRDGVTPFAEIGWYDGAVSGLQLDVGGLAVRASLGYMPVLLLEGEPAEDFHWLHSLQVNAELIGFVWKPTDHSRIGLSAGYHYNTRLEHGAGVAFQGEAALDDEVIVFYTFGLAWYWRGNERARAELNRPDADFNFPFGAGFQGGANVGLRFAL